MNNPTGGQGAPFESRLLVGGFNPRNPQRFGGSVAEICSTRTLPEGRRGVRGSKARNPKSTSGSTGATRSATGASGIPPSRFRAARAPHLNSLLWFANPMAGIPSLSGANRRKSVRNSRTRSRRGGDLRAIKCISCISGGPGPSRWRPGGLPCLHEFPVRHLSQC